ncbi:MAG: hypothetical protein ACLQPV_05555 [Vulcanimicrobiaceae bacterium]
MRYGLAGSAVGMRASAGPFLAAWSSDGKPSLRPGLAFLGELVADKMPFVGSRVRPGPLLARVTAGAFAATKLSDGEERSIALPAAIAIVSAIGVAILANRLRTAIADRTGVPDVILGLVEDGICLATIAAVANG